MPQVVRFPSRFCRSPPPSPTISDQAAGDHGFFVVLDFVSSDLRADFVRRGLMLGQAMFVQGEELCDDGLTASED